MGSDGKYFSEEESVIVSIHTPAWGVTISKKSGYNGTISFNPHSRVGSDELQERADNLTESFNPHSLVGSDTEKVQTYLRTGSFNPHSRVGSDLIFKDLHLAQRRFNPHSRVGSDVAYLDGFGCAVVSIHTPAWGVTDCSCCLL